MKFSNLWHYAQWLFEIAFFFAAGVGTWIRIRQAHSWPSVPGTVEYAHARETDDGSRFKKNWVAEIGYSYSVGGQYYSGYRWLRAWNERQAEQKIAGWKDRMVIVRHHPSKPEVSVLLPSDQVGGQLGN